MMSPSNRRVFLRSLGIGAGAFAFTSALEPKRARAAVGPERSYVFAYFSGGWDTLMGLDPRDPNVFTDANVGQTKIQLAWDMMPMQYPRTIIQPSGSNIDFGPVMDGIAPHFQRICVVRGMNMNTVSHDVGRTYMVTGKQPRGSQPAVSSVPTQIVAQQGDHSAMPNLTAAVETFNLGLPSFASGVTVESVADLITALSDGPQAPGASARMRLDAFRATEKYCDPESLNRSGFLSLIVDGQTKARSLVSGGLSSKFQFLNKTDPEMTAIAQRYGIKALTSAQAQAAMAYQALRYGMAQCVSIQATDQLDTHDGRWAVEQPLQQKQGWDALGLLVSDLESTDDPVRGGKLIDHTTIIAFSEFGRTPMLNVRDGRDHSLTASCMLIGAGIPGNKVVGKSSDVNMLPLPVNAMTGAQDDSGIFITPELVTASIMQSAGYDTTALRVNGMPALMA
jgi:uncharacterized protein (DUF1501 family)